MSSTDTPFSFHLQPARAEDAEDIALMLEALALEEGSHCTADATTLAKWLANGDLLGWVACLHEQGGQQSDPALSTLHGEGKEARAGSNMHNQGQQSDPALSTLHGEGKEARAGSNMHNQGQQSEPALSATHGRASRRDRSDIPELQQSDPALSATHGRASRRDRSDIPELQQSDPALSTDEHCAVLGFLLAYPGFDALTCTTGFHLLDMFIWPDFQRQGVGKALVQALRQHAQKQGAAWLQWHVLASNTSARAFYAAEGGVEQAEVLHSSCMVTP